jgi:hypothetical protein
MKGKAYLRLAEYCVPRVGVIGLSTVERQIIGVTEVMLYFWLL